MHKKKRSKQQQFTKISCTTSTKKHPPSNIPKQSQPRSRKTTARNQLRHLSDKTTQSSRKITRNHPQTKSVRLPARHHTPHRSEDPVPQPSRNHLQNIPKSSASTTKPRQRDFDSSHP